MWLYGKYASFVTLLFLVKNM
uniref:Uncharacterized protein n=1 Tax=Anguilla anguilla TaxID=7936 RepID=A0A0E9W4E9_ANGAN